MFYSTGCRRSLLCYVQWGVPARDASPSDRFTSLQRLSLNTNLSYFDI